jgi:hypothetical protein
MTGKQSGATSLSGRAAWILGLCLTVLFSASAQAAPEARILRIDPRASHGSGDPVITMVAEVVQSKRVSEATAPCAALRGNAQLSCMSESLEKPFALYAPFPFPAQQAVFTISVDDADRPAKYLSHKTWGEAGSDPDVGTAWLLLIDADRRMGNDFSGAKAIAAEFVSSMGPNDIVNVMFFNDRQVVKDSKWLPAQKKSAAQSFIDSVGSTYTNQGRNRSLLTIIRTAATDAFRGLGNVGGDVKVPLHQAMVVLSSGFGGADPSTTGPGALQLSQYMTGGRFPEDNTALPKAPVPVISIYFPHQTLDEFRQNSLEFMQGLANPEIGGFFTVVQGGGADRGRTIVRAVRTRFSKMYLVKWRVSCVAPSVTQSFKLVFNNVNPPILGDNSFRDVPIGIDPTSWPLDVNLEYTRELSERTPVYPGGTLRVYGDFCWGGDTSRAEVYFLPVGQQPPTDIQGADIERAKRAQQQLIAQGLKGRAVQTTDTFVEFEAPDNDKLIHGQGANAVARVLIYDNKARRTSGMTAENIIEVKATTAPLPLMWLLGGAFGLVVLALLLVVILRTGGKGRRAPAPARPMQGPPAPAPAPRPGVPQAAPPPPVVAAAPVGAPPPGGNATRATLQGAAGMFSILAGQESRVGRDATQCVVLLNDPRTSSLHASLKLEGGVLYVRDDGSNNGTFINGAQAPQGLWSPVPQGALLRFGPVEFSVRLD